MCGLTLCVSPICGSGDTHLAADHPGLFQSLQATNARRGPDAQGVFATRVLPPEPSGSSGGSQPLLVALGSSVLGLRGALTPQPLVGRRGVLAWNGQVFATERPDVFVPVAENDTRRLFAALEAGAVPEDVFAAVEGPFAYVYLEFATATVHFGVDPLSRRSLLIHIPSAAGASTSTNTAPPASFILTSARSAHARELGLPMVALDGGQTGVLDLGALRFDNAVPDYASALRMWTRTPLQPVNTALPPNTLDDEGAAAAVAAEVPHFVSRLTDAVRRRVDNIPPAPDRAARVALLFSGGVDCSLLAALVHRCLPAGEPLELINVAFQQPPKAPKAQKEAAGNLAAAAAPPATYDVPDRLSGLDAVAELRAACPGREFRFVEVDVTVEESKAHRQTVVDLMYPSNTEMDLSLAYPLYFASRGRGAMRATADAAPVPYTATAKVYLSGLGADEQLAGYTRHRRAYGRGDLAALIAELQLDVTRLPTRNLSRDDRLLAAHARDARYPFLDLGLVDYLSALGVWRKCALACAPGAGDKMLVRLAARACGLPRAGGRVKRAMQFGTRSSKLNDAAGKGHRVGEGLIRECVAGAGTTA